MTNCNHCDGRMVPEDSALIPALRCLDCGRLIPRTGVRTKPISNADRNRALRAARRRKGVR